jgi:hypothetical protein
MKRISVAIVLVIIVFIILMAFFLYPRELESILDIQQNNIYQLKIDYDLLALGNNNEANSIIVIDDKDTIIKIISILKDYKYSKKYFLIEPKPKSTPYEKIHFRIFYNDFVKVDMLTINEQGEIKIFTTQKGARTYKVIGSNIKLFDEIKSLLGLTSLFE